MTNSFEGPRINQDTIPGGFEELPLPENFWEIHDRITKPFKPKYPGHGAAEVDVVVGFEDVLAEPLGAGFLINTSTSTHQLAFALSLSPNPAIQKFLENENLTPEEIIKMLREKQVLSGLRIIDLGCGQPNFAQAAHALGAQVYTADIQELDPEAKKGLEGHIVIDLNQKDAIQTLQNETGGNFDLVSENIITPLPFQKRDVTTPTVKRVIAIGNALLKPGGYLYYGVGEQGVRDTVLRKK